MPTIAKLLHSAYTQSSKRPKLLFLLASLAGLLTAIVYKPAAMVISATVSINETNDLDSILNHLTEQFSPHIGTILIGYIALMAVTGMIIPFWARASASGGYIPSDGGVEAVLKRSLKAFGYILLPPIILLIALFISIPIVGTILVAGSDGGGLLMLVIALGFLWLNLFLNSAAHTAIALSALDRDITFIAALKLVYPYMRSIIGCAAIIWLALTVQEILFSGLAPVIFGQDVAFSINLILQGATLFLTSALHTGALYAIPSIQDYKGPSAL